MSFIFQAKYFCHPQIPASALYMIAWESMDDNGFKTSPILVEITLALQIAYVVIVPLLHGSVLDRRQQRQQRSYSVAFTKPKSMSIYSIMNQQL